MVAIEKGRVEAEILLVRNEPEPKSEGVTLALAMIDENFSKAEIGIEDFAWLAGPWRGEVATCYSTARMHEWLSRPERSPSSRS